MKSVKDNVERDRHVALTNLLSSIASKTVENHGNGEALTPQRVQELANQLSDMLIDVRTEGTEISDKGEIFNEDGDPVIEITEEVTDERPSLAPSTPFSSVSSGVRPALTHQELERRRRERDAILDMLEEEERDEEEKSKATLAKGRVQKLKGKSDLKSTPSVALPADAETSLLSPPPTPSFKPVEAQPTKSSHEATPSPKKSVSFADDTRPEAPSATEESPSWGDVVPARLRNSQPPSLRALSMDVTERKPGEHRSTKASSSRRVQVRTAQFDSDDEDDEEKADSSHPPLTQDVPDEEPDDGAIDDLQFDEGEADLDEAMIQREVALEYFKRQGILREAMAADPDLHAPAPPQKHPGDWDQENVPLEANLVSTKGHRSSVSRFKAERLVPDPVAPNALLASALKHGKLEGDSLVAPDDDDDDDDLSQLDEEGRRIVEALMRGDAEIAPGRSHDNSDIDPKSLINVGPTLPTPKNSRPTSSSTVLERSFQPNATLSATQSPSPPTAGSAIPSSPAPKKVSRFKREFTSLSPAGPPPVPSQSATISSIQPQKVAPSKTKPKPNLSNASAGKRIISATSRSSPLSSASSVPTKVSSPVARTSQAPGPSSASRSSSAASSSNVLRYPPPEESTYFPPGGFTSVILTPEDAARPPSSAAPAAPPASNRVQETRNGPSSGGVMGFNVVESSKASRAARQGPVEKEGRVSRFLAERF